MIQGEATVAVMDAAEKWQSVSRLRRVHEQTWGIVVEEVLHRPTVSHRAWCIAECGSWLNVCRDVRRCAKTVRDKRACRDIVRKWKNGVFHWWGSSSPISDMSLREVSQRGSAMTHF